MARNSTIATKFLVLSDTHNFEFTVDTSQPLKLPTPKADVLLHCGDLTEVGGISSFTRALKMLGSIDAGLKLVMQGSVGCPSLLQAVRRAKPLMHCFGHIHEGNGIEAVDWRKKQQSIAERPPRKNEAIHRFFENDPIENPYPEPFMWKDGRGGRTLAVNASIMTGDYKPENTPWLISLNLPRSS